MANFFVYQLFLTLIGVTGACGSGKTTLVLETAKKFLKKKKLNLNPYYFNLRNMKNPERIYSRLLRKSTNLKKSKKNSMRLIEDMITNKNPLNITENRYREELEKKSEKCVYLLILDNFDILEKYQSILYFFGDLLKKPKENKFSIIGISKNSLVLENFEKRILSRLGKDKLIIPPFNQKQIVKIVKKNFFSKRKKKVKNILIQFLIKKIMMSTNDLRVILSKIEKFLLLSKGEINIEKMKNHNFFQKKIENFNIFFKNKGIKFKLFLMTLKDIVKEKKIDRFNEISSDLLFNLFKAKVKDFFLKKGCEEENELEFFQNYKMILTNLSDLNILSYFIGDSNMRKIKINEEVDKEFFEKLEFDFENFF